MVIVHDPECGKYQFLGHPERPARVIETARFFKQQEEVSLEWISPEEVSQEMILRAHTQEHLDRLQSGHFHDPDTPFHPDMYQHALRSVGGAIAAMHSALKGKPALSLMRPPGHHAEKARIMGFCYLNQAAICALEAVTKNLRVAVYDFDVHHGNGTEHILRDCENAAYFSAHQFPAYPGTGEKNSARGLNCPVLPDAPGGEFLGACRTALDGVKDWKPDLLIVSAGFDAYKDDPIAQQSLLMEDFQTIGRWIAELNIPHFSILEGGYSNDLPQCIFAYVKGLYEIS
ncbi:MAG: histone deacetylase family protein [Verrucomicrobiota bacterium]